MNINFTMVEVALLHMAVTSRIDRYKEQLSNEKARAEPHHLKIEAISKLLQQNIALLATIQTAIDSA